MLSMVPGLGAMTAASILMALVVEMVCPPSTVATPAKGRQCGRSRCGRFFRPRQLPLMAHVGTTELAFIGSDNIGTDLMIKVLYGSSWICNEQLSS